MDTNNMLRRIAESPIVSSDTLRPDHLCSALIAEADRLGITLERDLWQPAAAIAAHGMRGVCLDLPPKLSEIAGDVVSELFEALNWAAPSGCYLGSSEGDGALFLWQLSIQAQADAINADPSSRWEAGTLEVPEHWLSAIINGDETGFDYSGDERDYRNYKAFCEGELSDGWRVSSYDEESEFSHRHDASPYGVLACNVIKCVIMRERPVS